MASRTPESTNLQFITAPHLTPLFAHLADRLTAAPLPPREQEIIVVPSGGMRRWLTLQFADRLGCAGSFDLPFPANFMRDISRRVAGERPAWSGDADPYTREALAWRIDALLRELPADDPVYQPLHTYLITSDDRSRFGLAEAIAGRLDDYQVYRADVLRAWEDGHDEPLTVHAAWQAALWRNIRADIGPAVPSPADRLRDTLAVLGSAAPLRLPARVAVFGVSALSPLFVELLAALAKRVPVTVYSAVAAGAAAHPLVQAFGAQGRELAEMLQEQGAVHVELSASARGSGVLGILQGEIADEAAGDTELPLADADRSLLVHNAHGPVRQLEIVRDQLLAALAADSTLRPHDLLLLVPDATEWAPLVEAVFGASAGDGAIIPYRVTDRPMRRVQPAADALSRLMALEGGRLARSEVFALLAAPLVRQAADLTDAEVDTLEELTRRANVRWGFDAQSRVALGLPAYEDATWRMGMDRVLLGVAVGPADDPVLGILPEASDTAGQPELTAKLTDWVERLVATLTDWRTARSLPEWSAALSTAIGTFVRADGVADRPAIAALTATVGQLQRLSVVSGHSAAVTFGVVRDWMEAQLDADGFGGGFLAGGMTVAALKPMRSLPFRVIAVAGLDDGVFPRRDRRAAFDLLEHERRRGDRDLRSDDRQLFLDLLMAAGDRLILSYSGRAVSDNAARAPSVVIDELLDHLDRRTNGGARDALIVEHPLQPFSAAYFTSADDDSRDLRLFTYSRRNASAAQASAAPAVADYPFVVPCEIPVNTSGAVCELTLNDLVECWCNPSKFYCRRVLELSLGADAPDVEDDEPLALDAMRQGGVKAHMLKSALSGARDADRERQRLIAAGDLPPGALGDAWHEQLWSEVGEALDNAGDLSTPAAAPIDIQGAGWRLRGRLEGLQQNRRLIIRAGSVRADHYIKAWVEHVVMCAARQQGTQGLPANTEIVTSKRKSPERIVELPNAIGHLDSLVGAVRRGLVEPLPVFPQAVWAWWDAVRPKSRRSAPKDSWDEAVKAYSKEKSTFTLVPGDAFDPYVALCFRGAEPMKERQAEFEALANVLFAGWKSLGAGK